MCWNDNVVNVFGREMLGVHLIDRGSVVDVCGRDMMAVFVICVLIMYLE